MTDSQTKKYFEDYMINVEQTVGSLSLSSAEMISFASKYDPQDFHIDPEKAAAGPFAGLIASGWHTAAAVMRLLVDHYLNNATSLGSPGLDELRWLAPVRPGDVLTVRAKVIGARRSSSKPDRGVVHTRVEVNNQNGILVMTMQAVNMITCREPALS